MWQNAWPALVLLALMVGIAWALKRARALARPGVPGRAVPLKAWRPCWSAQRVVTLQVGQRGCHLPGARRRAGQRQHLHEMALLATPCPVGAGGTAGRCSPRLAQQP